MSDGAAAWRILAADDDRVTLTVLAGILRELAAVEVAGGGEAALQRLAADPLPDLVLLDAMMPDLDGFEVCARIKADPRLRGIPVIFVTGHADRESEARALETGAVDFISKPLNKVVVQARVRTQLALVGQQRELQRANQALMQKVALESSKIESLMQLIPHPIWAKDRQGRFISLNQAALRVFGHRPDDLLGQTGSADLGARIFGDISRFDRETVTTREQHSYEVETPGRTDGTPQQWEIVKTPLTDEQGACEGLVAIARNVTENKRAEQRLRTLSLVVEQSPNGIIITDAEGRIEFANDSFLRSIGYDRAETIGRRAGYYRSGSTPAETYRTMWEALNLGRSWTGVFYNRTKAGDEIVVSAYVAPIVRPDGVTSHFFAIQEDITEKERLRSEFDRARAAKEAAEAASEAKSRFLANMSHEIRTPMNAIIGLTHLLLQDGLEPGQRARLEKVGGAAEHLLGLINDILDISKIEAGRFELSPGDFRIADVVANVRTMMAERTQAKGLRLLTLVDGLPEYLHGDAMRLAQVLINFVGNAVKFTEAGSISLIARPLDEDDQGVTVRFVVEDTGIGIDADKLPRLFQAFEQGDASTTRKYGGTGLGLRISKHLAQLMGGDAGVESEQGRGSAFWFTARLEKVPPERIPAQAAVAEGGNPMLEVNARCRGARVLLAEDNPINQEVSGMMLRNAGIEVDLAPDGLAAVAAAEANAYDLILMDMQMPEMDGLDATRAIRRLPAHAATPIIALTANAFSEDRNLCLAAGMNGHLGKPVQPAVLYAALLQWIPPRASAVPEAAQPSAGIPACDAVPPAPTFGLDGIPGLDYAVGLKQMSGNAEMYERLVRQVAGSVEKELDAIRSGMEAGQPDKARRLAHGLKGSAGTLGMGEVHRAAAELEAALRGAGTPAVVAERLDSLAAACRKLAAAVGAAR